MRFWTARTGVGQPLVLCHGGPGIWDYFDDVAAMFEDIATVVRWDQRGCGRSERRGPYTVSQFVTDLDTISAQATVGPGASRATDAPGPARVNLLGHSWGALLALFYALDHPDRVDRLIYVSGVGIDPDHTWKPAHHRTFAARVDPRWNELDQRDRTPDEDRELAILQWATDFEDPVHAERMATPWHGLNWECAQSLNADVKRIVDDDLAARCRNLTVPTLIVDGRHDPRPRSAVDSLEHALPNVRRVTLDAGHSPWAEDPSGFRQAIRDFLADSPACHP
ncbi:alpha/beta fold hydrolase [Cryptosporangium sp. NPDC048952]|uniref:alpha/beta fold hydrolase n=1 Tax=Cryptosporangium sp. NPDC048952 TaxID=3363961 RepID=UPI0037205A37